ncbi:hypothetical protein RRG08_024560 [Elysia crispata]|uniref:Uncharacterized protein n=1 Tax=Elysia crispata TaxID=231223 RepID=A0AAE0ZW52_9GAST|nr:hypothetical protein RRG08_024560 [Elysia crispata]
MRRVPWSPLEAEKRFSDKSRRSISFVALDPPASPVVYVLSLKHKTRTTEISSSLWWRVSEGECTRLAPSHINRF